MAKKKIKIPIQLQRDNGLVKSKKIIFKIPARCKPKILELIKKHKVNSFQHLFDILVISGIIYKKTEILEFVRKHRQSQFEITRLYNLSKLGQVPKKEVPIMPRLYITNMAMYPQDHNALKQYLIEDNMKQQWLWNILFEEGFANEEPCIIKLIERHNELEIASRKEAVVRLLDDKYVETIPQSDAAKILDIVTKEYDQRKFDPSIISFVESRLQMDKMSEEEREEKELEIELNKKITKLRASRSKKVNKLIEPR